MKTKEKLGCLIGMVVGGYVGNSIGIDTLGTVINGLIPISILGCVVGYLVVKSDGSSKWPEEN